MHPDRYDGNDSIVVTEENFLGIFHIFLAHVYRDEMAEDHDECPYIGYTDGSPLGMFWLSTWFACECLLYSERVAAIREFTRTYVKDEHLASRIFRMSDILYSVFKVVKNEGGGTFTAAKKSGKKYTIRASPEHASNLPAGTHFAGMIFPWYDDGAHRLCLSVTLTPQDVMKKKYDRLPFGMPRSPGQHDRMIEATARPALPAPPPRLAPVLNTFPAYMINDMCKSLKISKPGDKNEKIAAISALLTSRKLSGVIGRLQARHLTVLRTVAESGGMVRVGSMKRKIDGSEDLKTLWIKSDSQIDPLRKQGLLIVRAYPADTEDCELAAIPLDVLAAMRRFNCLGRQGRNTRRP